VLDRLLQGCDGLIIVSILVNLDVGASLEEAGQVVKGLCLLIEHDNAFHEVRVLMPIGSLQKVSSKHIGL